MEVPSVFFGLLLSLAVQWLLVAGNPTGLPPTTTTGLAADVTSTTPDGASHAGDRTVYMPVTDSATAEQDGLTVNQDTATTNPQLRSAEGGTSNVAPSTFTDIPNTTSKEQDIMGVNPTTITMDHDSITVGPTTATSELHLLTTSWDSLAASAAGVLAVQEGGSTRLSTVHTNSYTATPGPDTETIDTNTNPETRTTRPAKVKVEPICPAGCECEHLEVHCSRAGLVEFPEGLDPRTTYLDVGHNRLTAIADDELAQLGLTQLTSLICDDNVIESVGLYAFRGLRDLALLQLSGNRIRHLSPFVFVGNKDLRHIDLTGNPLELERGPVLMVQQLEWLDLDQCNITQLSLDAFRDMRGLRYLNLSGNRISSLTLSHFSGLNYLRYIKLNGNPLLCDCEMKPLWRWFRQQTVHVDAKCVAPANGSTQSWNFLELLACDVNHRS